MRVAPTVTALALVLGVSCSREPPPLDVHRVLGRSEAELIERWGEPWQHVEASEGRYGHLLWQDVLDTGVRVFVVIKGGQASYVSYRFEGMDPFDEDEALRMIGVERPDAEPQTMTTPGAKRWRPFEAYDKLTLNPRTRFISVGSDPVRVKAGEAQGPGSAAERASGSAGGP